MSPTTKWVLSHLGTAVVLPDGDAWTIETTTSDGRHVLLRREDDTPRIASAEAVRRAYLSESAPDNS